MFGESIAKLFQRKPKEEESLNTKNHPYRGDLPSFSNESIFLEPTEIKYEELSECAKKFVLRKLDTKGTHNSNFIEKVIRQDLPSGSESYKVFYDNNRVFFKGKSPVGKKEYKEVLSFVIKNGIIDESDTRTIKEGKEEYFEGCEPFDHKYGI